MTEDNRQKFQLKYQAGKEALERGQYRLSIANLEAAKELSPPGSRTSGEAQIWLVTAYQAADKIEQAIALAQELVTHPDWETRQQAQRLLYIIKAPKLVRPKEWMSEIPDLTNKDSESGRSQYVAAKKRTGKSSVTTIPEATDNTPVETQDNQFIWFASFLVAVIIASLVWLSRN